MAAPEDFETLDFERFHREELPKRLAAGNGALARAGLRRQRPLAFRIETGECWTYVPCEGGIELVRGDERAETVIELSREAWQGLVHEYESGPGLIYGGRVKATRGSAKSLLQWDPALRGMYQGRPFFDPAHSELRDARGRPLDPQRAFARGDDPEAMAEFLRCAGFLRVRGVFAPDEAARLREAAIRLKDVARKGDGESWWGKNARGDEILCRVTSAAQEPALGSIPTDPRMLALAALSDHDLAPRGYGGAPGVTVIYKNPHMTEGLGDLPWHRDCGMGGHAILCPVLIASVFLTRADAQTGALHALPGSWRAAAHFVDANAHNAPRGVVLEAEPGDVTLHYGDTMHAAPPPTIDEVERCRISAVTGYVRDGVRPHGAPGRRSYNDVLHQREDGQIDHLSRLLE